MAVGDLVRINANGTPVVGVQLTNASRGGIARIFSDGDVAAFRPQGEPVQVIAAAGTPRAVAAARLITDSNAPYAGSVDAAARANGLTPTTENAAADWVRDRALVFGSTTVTDADRQRSAAQAAGGPRSAAPASSSGTGNS